jgi:hypothetical protein
MKPIDYVKAFALAFVIMAMLIFLSYPVVSLYAFLIAPGHPPAFYRAAASDWLVPAWVHIAGPVFFFFTGWLFTGRVRHRNAYAFIGALCGWYLLLELASFVLLGGFAVFFTSGTAPWVVLQFVAGFLGVLVARRTLPANEQPIP